jgi:4-amino-4-deoxy-L-arabinose transferase-like glycosyltransferase
MKGIRWSSSRCSKGWLTVLLLLVCGAGLWYRWLYARDVSFFVDEYLTVRAADRILTQGAPLLPSGNFYSHGLLLSYVEALVIGLGGSQSWLLRLPVLLLSTAVIPLTYWFGRRLFSPAAGLLAAALLAFAPEAILWGGRVRMYAPLQLFVLIASIAFYLWVIEEQERPAYRVLFVLAYWAALFSHAEAMLLLPVWGLLALVQRGWRWCLRPTSLVTFALSGLSIVIEMLLRRLGPPVQAWQAPGVFEPLSRQYLGTALDWPGVIKVAQPLFLAPLRLPLTLLALAGLGYLLLMRVRKGALWSKEQRSLTYLYALLLPILVALFFVVDPSWKSPRYGFMLLPHYFLIVGVLVAQIGHWLLARLGRRWSWVGVTSLVILIAVASWPSAVAATRETVPGYDWGFAYVEAHEQPGDVVITFLCPAAFLHLGRCDYLAIPADYNGFAFQKDGRWVSGWDEVPMLDSSDALKQALDNAPGAWFVVDKGRFPQRYSPEFVQAIWDDMDLVAMEQEVLVFHGAQGRPQPESRVLERHLDFEDGISLIGYAVEPDEILPGQDVSLVLYWEARTRVSGNYTVFVHLQDEQGQTRSQVDELPLNGLYPTTEWQPGPVLPDHHILHLPQDLGTGRFRFVIGLYDTYSKDRLPLTDEHAGADSAILEYVWVGEPPPPAFPQYRTEAVLGEEIRLLGYDLSPGPLDGIAAGEALRLTLYWQPLAEIRKDYTVFVHLVDKEGQIRGQGDGPPLEGGYPTSYWHPGEAVKDTHTVTVDAEASPGNYRLLVGLYTLGDGIRLPVTFGPQEGPDSVLLTSLTVR